MTIFSDRVVAPSSYPVDTVAHCIGGSSLAFWPLCVYVIAYISAE
jgi:hypothetical protein